MKKANCKRSVLTLVLKVIGRSEIKRVFQNLGPAIVNASVLVLGMFSNESANLVSCENVLGSLTWDLFTVVGQSAMFYKHGKICIPKI